jgi:hypothetical protein
MHAEVCSKYLEERDHLEDLGRGGWEKV